jgi:hypothetical protein
MKTRHITVDSKNILLRREGSTVTGFTVGSGTSPMVQCYRTAFPTVAVAKAFMNRPSL